jgi:hypothetical protein
MSVHFCRGDMPAGEGSHSQRKGARGSSLPSLYSEKYLPEAVGCASPGLGGLTVGLRQRPAPRNTT